MSYLTALNDSKGKPVDWWFIYKLPTNVPNKKAKGFSYLYFDARTKTDLKLSSRTLNNGNNAIHNTLKQVFDGRDSNNGYILYNDENPDPKAKDDGRKGHIKGILAFNKKDDSGLLLTHSTPRFPAVEETELPNDERLYGQTYLCITLENYAAASQIAHQLRHQQEPQVYASVLPKNIKEGEDIFQLAKGQESSSSGLSSVIEIKSRGGTEFKIFGKNRRWGKDFWVDLVAPSLNTDMVVESWRRGKVTPTIDPNVSKDEVDDIQDIDLGPLGLKGYAWHYTKDHAKWAISVHDKDYWVCIGDINRMVSQEKRGGGTVAFQNETLWNNLNKIWGGEEVDKKKVMKQKVKSKAKVHADAVKRNTTKSKRKVKKY